MHIAWPDLAAALGLMLVIEGILPFVSPGGVRRVFARLAAMDDAALRIAGAASMDRGRRGRLAGPRLSGCHGSFRRRRRRPVGR